MFDLHIHTRYSADAQNEPAEYIERACKLNLSGIAITEHRNINSTAEAIELAQRANLRYITGAEFNAIYRAEKLQVELHILAYCFDVNNVHLHNYLSAVRQQEEEYLDILFKGLSKLGIDITRARVLEAIEENDWPRKEADSIYIRRLMRMLGYAKDKRESFELERHAISAAGYDELSQNPSIDYLFDQMQLAEAICVLAHPCYYSTSVSIVEKIVSDLVKKYGISGLELWHPSNPIESRDWLAGLAKRYSLFLTGGSDAHNIDQLACETVDERILQFLKPV